MMTHESVLKELSQLVRSKLESNGFCYSLVGTVNYGGGEYHIYSAAFSELPDERGKLFFRLSQYGSWHEIEILAENLDRPTLLNILTQNKNEKV